jgi:hypothetical protein
MRRFKIFQCALAGIAGLGLAMPPATTATERAPRATAGKSTRGPAVTDVALLAGGVLQGRVVDERGLPLANAAVSLRFEDRAIVAAKTNSQGYFVVQGLRGGTFQISAGGGGSVHRLWVENSAPPLANSGVLIVAGQQTAPGENPFWGSGPDLTMLGVMGGVVTAAVIATSDHRSGG